MSEIKKKFNVWVNKYFLIIVFFIVLIFGISVVFSPLDNYLKNKERAEMLSPLSSELVTWKNKDKENVARIQTLETTNLKTFTEIASKDSMILHLQEVVKKYKKQLKSSGNVTVLNTNTTIDTVFSTVVTKDTTSVIYTSQVDLNGWVVGSVISSSVGTKLSLQIKNEYEVVVGNERHFFKKDVPFVEVTNLNPYTETEALRTYSVKPSKIKRWGIGPCIGYGLDDANGLKGSAFIGVCLTYNVILF